MNFWNREDPVTLVRSPILIKLLSGRIIRGSKPLSLVKGSILGIFRGERVFIASAIALIWFGVVPQQPPTKFTRELSANSSMIDAMDLGVSSYSPISLGSPALG